MKKLLYLMAVLGMVLMSVAISLTALASEQPSMKPMSFIAGWVSSTLIFISISGAALFCEDIAAIRQRKQIIVSIWILLLISTIGSTIYTLLFPDWIIQKFTMAVNLLIVVLLPCALAFYRLVYREIVREGEQEHESEKERTVVKAEENGVLNPLKQRKRARDALYEERIWTKSHITSGFLFLTSAVLALVIFPSQGASIALILVIVSLMTLLSPYKNVVSSECLETRDLVNLFGWKTSLREISRITIIPGKKEIEITYRYGQREYVRKVKSARPEMLAKAASSVAPHIDVDMM